MIIEAGTRSEFKHCLLWHVLTLFCRHGHRYVVDPDALRAWDRGDIPKLHECSHCQQEFEMAYQSKQRVPDDYQL
jgi:hypothetical protein